MSMGRWSRRCVLVLFLVAGTIDGAQAETQLRVLTDNNPPLATEGDDGAFHGLAVDMLMRAVAGRPVTIKFEQLPWHRAYVLGQSEPDVCLIGIGRTPEREAKFTWVGPFTKGGLTLFGAKDRVFDVRDMKDVIDKGYVLGIATDDLASALPARFPGVRVEKLSGQSLGPKMLALGRFDLWASGRILGIYKLRHDNVGFSEVLKVDDIDISMGCNLRSDSEAMAAISAGMSQIIQQGIAADIERNYLEDRTEIGKK